MVGKPLGWGPLNKHNTSFFTCVFIGYILFLMDGNGETTILHVKIWNHPIETSIFQVDVLGSRDG